MHVNIINKRLRFANTAMLLTFTVTMLAITFVYGLADNLSLPVQIFGHIIIMIMPACFKLMYVFRLVCLKQLGIKE